MLHLARTCSPANSFPKQPPPSTAGGLWLGKLKETTNETARPNSRSSGSKSSSQPGRGLARCSSGKTDRLEFEDLLSDQGVWTVPTEILTVVTAGESDNRYLECAVAGGTYVVTGDEHLLDTRNYQGINIVSPAAFVVLLEIDAV